jgi:DNA-binding HxlR family transcriptional regulator
MSDASYNQFCPLSMASEIVATRWTLLLLRELLLGSTRFNDLRRGLPNMSPALLSKRLKELEEGGIVCRHTVPREKDVQEYRLTESGLALRPIVEAVGMWGKEWIKSEATLKNLDAKLLMWDVRRNINTEPMPKRKCVIAFIFPEQPIARRNYWLVVDPGEEVDLCFIDPGFDVDLYISTDLRTMTAIWLGYATVTQSLRNEKLMLTGNRELADNVLAWLKLNPLAPVAQRA